MRRSQMMAIAALMTATAAPYVLSADSVKASTSFTEENVDFILDTDGNFNETTSTEGYFKSNFFGKVNLEIAADGKKYAIVTTQGHSYGFKSFADVNGNAIEVISESGSAEAKDLVRVLRLPLDEKYQTSFVGKSSDKGDTQYNLDLSQEKFEFELVDTENASYFKAWVPNADVVTLKDGSKVAYITFAGHSYGIETIYQGIDKSKAAAVVSSTGSVESKDLTRVVRITLDENAKAQLFMPSDRGDYTLTFDFTEKEAVSNFATVADLVKASSLKVEYGAVDAQAGSWHPMAFPSAVSNPVAKAVNGKIQVTYDTAGVTAFKATQNGKDVAVTLKDEKATFTVDTLEGLAFEVTATSSRGEATYQVTLNKAQKDAEVVETPTTGEVTIPSTTDVKAKKATYKLEASSSTSYFKDFFGKVSVVEIDGKQYADLTIQDKAFGLSFDYVTESGTRADVLEVAGNRAEHSSDKYEGFRATVRTPIEVKNNNFEFVLEAIGGQPGTGQSNTYQFTFTGAIQEEVTLPFTDIKDEVTSDYVQQLASWGVVNLTTDKFNPNNGITRGEYALMVARALNLKAAKTNTFKDVLGEELSNAVQALFETGIINGYGNNTFKPNQKLTREEAAMITYRLLTKQLGYKATATIDDLNFNDSLDINIDEAKLAFAELQKSKVMVGYQGFINPKQALTRAAMAKVLVESLNLVDFTK